MSTDFSIDKQPTFSDLGNEIKGGIAEGKKSLAVLVNTVKNKLRHSPANTSTPAHLTQENQMSEADQRAATGFIDSVKKIQLKMQNKNLDFSDSAEIDRGRKAADDAFNQAPPSPKNW